MREAPLVLYCDCAYSSLVPDEAKASMRAALTASGWHVEAVPDLCRLAAERDERLGRWAAEKDVTIVACHSRAVRWLFRYAGATLAEGVRIFNLRGESPAEIAAALGLPSDGTGTAAPARPAVGEWVPWFPVIDYDRCTRCGQCASFCVFGVYRVAPDQKVEVVAPASCKNNCPACARMCPVKAIIFPKSNESAIDGSEPPPEKARPPEETLDDMIAKRRERAAAFRRAREGHPQS